MKAILLIICFSLLAFNLSAQQKIVKYYKDFELKKTCSESKAKFKITIYGFNERVDSIKAENIKKGCLFFEKYFKDGIPFGIWHSFDEECNLISERDFDKIVYKDSIINLIPKATKYDKLAQFPGGEDHLFHFLSENLDYPAEARESKVTGIVYLGIIINEHGEIEHGFILRGVNPYLDYEAWRVINLMPKWEPAKIDGHAASSLFNIPIKFTLR